MGWNTLEIMILLVIVYWQFKTFASTRQDIWKLGNLYPGSLRKDDHLILLDYQGSTVEQLTADDHSSADFQQIVAATNAYLRNNKGSADFNIIKSISERISESHETQIASSITTPLYLGLMGTFIGVIMGLGHIITKGSDQLAQSAVLGQAINGLLLGVGIAMIASFVGLALTTYSNVVDFKAAVLVRNRNKNNYYNFLQSELLPNLDNNLYSALSMLKSNIVDFNQKFAGNLKAFDQNFGSNVQNLQTALSSMSEQIKDINSNTHSQIEFLQELRQMDYQGIAKANIKVLDKLKDTGPMLSEFIREHQALNTQIKDSNLFMEKLGALMNRVSAFEDNINGLGREIQHSEMLGSETINLVRQQLAAINSKEALINEYASKSYGEVQQYLKGAAERIAELKRKIEIDFEQAFDFNAEGNLMQNLTYLKPINEGITKLHKEVNSLAQIKQPLQNGHDNTPMETPRSALTHPKSNWIQVEQAVSGSNHTEDEALTKNTVQPDAHQRPVNGKRSLWQRWFGKRETV
ncbi:hypothetical protein [Mucilaginibacter aquatilis]|uniref:MotA/TolQ/ExbB proton channel domain-containing protein n=1 Tax=Mucilaginibacter aquatilis TaxID=1517760 RepID=A0A6I4I616_9SPHI|nr:hypothetical protein [Mucilaginibacter aquatilis]MVN90521.1 hypothetical protein [Mucilaginibacter aquatilis]